MKKFVHFFLTSVFFIMLAGNISQAQVTFGTGKINVRVDKYGAIRIFTTEGTDTVQHINRVSILAAGNTNEVLDYWKDVQENIPTALVSSPVLSDYEISGTYDNTFSDLPPDFLVEQYVYGWNNQSYCIAKCVIKNRETAATPILAGLDVIQFVDETWEDDKIFYDDVKKVLIQFDVHHVGIKILSEPITSAQVFMWYAGYQNSDPDYYGWLHEGTFDTDTLISNTDGGVGILGGNAGTLQPNETKTFYFAVAVGSTGSEMLTNMQDAVQKYNQLTALEFDDNTNPSDYVLEQNFPNPFNPETSIKFSIPQQEFVTLKIYNSLGQIVAVPIEKELSSGNYTLKFDGRDLSSGVYVYTIQSGNFIQSRKMILMK